MGAARQAGSAEGVGRSVFVRSVYNWFCRMMDSSKPAFALAFCSDQHMELPLLIAVTSALGHISTAFEVHIYLMLSGVGEKGTARIRTLLDRVGRPYSLTLLPPPDDALFHGFRRFYGAYAAYYRLVLPDLIPEDRVLYLDTDTVTATDLSPLATIDMQGYAMGFVVQSTMGTALESRFFLKLGNRKDDPAFNSGVMLVDSKQWRDQQCSQRLIEFCRTYPEELLAADQTALNALFSKSCLHLDARFNVRLSTVDRIEIPAEAVYHFFGSPKPWDIFGNLFHPYAGLWNEYRRSAAMGAMTLNPYTQVSAWRRLPRLFGAYLHVLRWRFVLMRDRRMQTDDSGCQKGRRT
jgi:lipopolysaccharide biosynthesis glycosyltransferase